MKKVKTYVQAKHCIEHVQDYVKGSKALVIIGSFQADRFKQKVCASLSVPYECIVYEQECSEANTNVLVEKMIKEHFDCVIGFGGGKILDIVKAITYYDPCFLMVIPSSASMDGACSALSVLYHDDHSFDRFLYLPSNPDVVLVDTQIIFEAPFKLLCAGMADAISSYYDYTYALSKNKIIDEEVAVCAQRCYDVIYHQYQNVKEAYAKGIHNEVVDQVIKTNVYDSAVAFENIDCEFSHVLANATTKIKGSKGMHGERVGVSTLFQLLLENKLADYERLKKMLDDLSMPTTLLALGITSRQSLVNSIVDEFKTLQIDYTKENIMEALAAL